MTHPIFIRKLLALSALVIALFIVSVKCYAQTPPDAGQILREMQQQPALNPPQTEPIKGIEETTQDQQKAGDTRFLVKAINISGNSEIQTDKLQALVIDLVGGEHSLVELNAATARITAYYRAQGYTVAHAYLPVQEIKDGAVMINIIEGRIASQKIDNQSRLSDERVNALLGQIHEGDVIKSAQIDRSLLLLNDTPGVASARATLQAGEKVGTSDLLVELKPAGAISGNISLNNYGNRYTGQYQLNGTLNVNSPRKIGDQITLTVLTSDQNLTYGRAAYQMPAGSDGMRVGAAHVDIRYRLGKEFEALQVNGSVGNTSIFAVYPFVRSQKGNLSGMFMWEKISLTDTVSDRSIRLANMNLSGEYLDRLGGGGISGLDLSLKLGRLDIGSPAALAIDNGSARTNGAYTRVTYAINRLQGLTTSDRLRLLLSGQQANKNLDSSEKFSLGGAKGVRAYPPGEAVGDEGYLVNLELVHDFTELWQGALFYDSGTITINRNPYGTATTNSRSLSGVGLGINANMAATQFKASLARRTKGGEPTSIPTSAAGSVTLWMQLSHSF